MYITGDIHGSMGLQKLGPKLFPQGEALKKDDFCIITGDFGLIWDNSLNEKKNINWLDSRNFTTLFIDGNHENFNLLNSYPVEYWKGGKIHRISESVIHLMRGQVFNIKGVKFLTFGGADSIDKIFRKRGISWWEQEMPSDEEYEECLHNLKQNGNKVDYIITHTISSAMLEIIGRLYERKYKTNKLTDFLEMIDGTLQYKKWYFGHFHYDIEFPDNKIMVYKKLKKLEF